MQGTALVCKTQAGSQELRLRKGKLAPRLRAMLIMADGAKTVDELRLAAAQLGAPPDFLETLLRHGFVELPQADVDVNDMATADPAERLAAAQTYVNNAVVDALGIRAYLLTLKLQKCTDATQLQGLLPEATQAVAQTQGEEAAKAFEAKVLTLLS